MKSTPLPLILILSLSLLLSSACRTSKLQKVSGVNRLQKSFEQSSTFNGLTGFLLMDQSTQKTIYEKNADTYFTPASNTKILTLYAAMKILGATAPGLKYANSSDGKLTIQGTGHPAFLNPDFPDETDNTFEFLQKQNEALVFCDCNFQDKKYGSGWSWDDYYYYYQKEKSPLPIYGNTVTFKKPSKMDTVQVSPALFQAQTSFISDSTIQNLEITRNWDDNHFTAKIPPNSAFTERSRPFRTDRNTIVKLLSDTLQRAVTYCNNVCTKHNFYHLENKIPLDVLYKELMQPSDNFVAEQLLLLCSHQLFDTLHTARLIGWVQDSLFKELPQAPKWVDGSGLSRYNMITPRSLVAILSQLYMDYPEERLFQIFPTGGVSGTIKNWYGGLEQPYVFAKTGTLRHIHCLSGYIITKSGRRLIFSFMHNNYIGDMWALKREMEKILQLVYSEF